MFFRRIPSRQSARPRNTYNVPAASAVLARILGAICLFDLGHVACAEGSAEYRIKAAFLGNFIAYTEWPDSVGDTLNLCIYGPDPFGDNLDKLKGKAIGHRSVALRRVNSVDGLGSCQIVFITTTVIGNLPRVLDSTSGKPVLVVADSPGAAHRGAAINMEMDASKVTFEANVAAARGNGLTLSANMLRLAVEVIK